MRKKCYGYIDNYKSECWGCLDSSDCLLQTIKRRRNIMKNKNNSEEFEPIENVYSVMYPYDYEGLKKGDVVGVIAELDGVAVVDIKNSGENMLVRLSHLTPFYRVNNLCVKEKDYKVEVFTDKYKKVVVDMTIDGMRAEGVASCSPEDTFSLSRGYAIAKCRALIDILKQSEYKLTHF